MNQLISIRVNRNDGKDYYYYYHYYLRKVYERVAKELRCLQILFVNKIVHM